jgi:serine/threonine protein kinase
MLQPCRYRTASAASRITSMRHCSEGRGPVLHGCSILHRDIKSPNMLLLRNAATGRTVAEVRDFGLALAVDLVKRTAGIVATTASAVH